VNSSKGSQRLLLQELHRVEEVRTLKVFTRLSQGVCASSSKRVRVEKLRRYNTFVISLKESTGGLHRRRFEQGCKDRCWRTSPEREHSDFLRNPQGGGIDGQGLQRKIVKSRQPLDLGKVAQGLSLKEQRKNPEETSRYWCHRVFIRLRIETLKVPKSRERISTVDLGRTHGRRSGQVGVWSIGFSKGKNFFHIGIVIRDFLIGSEPSK
jgi:hypothetical protein